MTKPAHLFVSEADGALYDTRVNDWHNLPPLRVNYRLSHCEIKTCADMKAALRNGGSAWPGGYPLYFITSDGAALSFKTARSELRSILDAIQHDRRDSWRIVGLAINYEDSELYDEHTGERIESAYGDDTE